MHFYHILEGLLKYCTKIELIFRHSCHNPAFLSAIGQEFFLHTKKGLSANTDFSPWFLKKNSMNSFFQTPDIPYRLMPWCWGQKVFWPLWYRIAPHFVLPQSSKTFKIRPNRATFSCFWRVPSSKILLQASLHRILDL